MIFNGAGSFNFMSTLTFMLGAVFIDTSRDLLDFNGADLFDGRRIRLV